MRPDLPQLLRSTRQEAELTQLEVAERAGVDQAALSRYERGLRTPTLGTLERVLAAMGQQIVVELEPLDAQIDREIDRLAAMTPAERIQSCWLLVDVPEMFAGLAWAFGGAAAGVLQGAPLPLDRVDVLMLDDPVVLDTVARVLRQRLAAQWWEEDRLFAVPDAVHREALRAAAGSRWELGGAELLIRAVSAATLASCSTVAIEEEDLGQVRVVPVRVVPVPAIEAADQRAARALARFRQRLAAGGAS